MKTDITKNTRKRINHFKNIINNKHSSLTDEEKKAIGVLHTLFREEIFQELIIDESKKEGFSIYLINNVYGGVEKYALITGKIPINIDKSECEFTDSECHCREIKGMSVYGDDFIFGPYYYAFEKEIKPKKISPSMAWECYINFIAMKHPIEYQMACDAYERACDAYKRSFYSECDTITRKVYKLAKKMASEKFEKKCDEVIKSIKSIAIE